MGPAPLVFLLCAVGWNAPPLKPLAKLEIGASATPIAFAPNEKLLAVRRDPGDAEKNQELWIYDLASGKPSQVKLSKRGLDCCQFSPDSALLAVGSATGHVCLYKYAAAEPTAGSDRWSLEATYDPIEGIPLLYLSFISGGKQLFAFGTSPGGTVATTFDAMTGEVKNTKEFEFVAPGVTLLPDESAICLSCFTENKFFTTTYALPGWTEKNSIDLQPGAVIASPDGRLIAHFSAEGLVIGQSPEAPLHIAVWDTKAGKKIKSVELAGDSVASTPAFSRDSRYIAYVALEGGHRVDEKTIIGHVAGHDVEQHDVTYQGGHRVVKVWDTTTFKTVAPLPEEPNCSFVQFLPKSNRLATIDDRGSLRIWDISARLPSGGAAKNDTKLRQR